jgi:hypothetical protein
MEKFHKKSVLKGNDHTITVYDVDDAKWETGFIDEICEFECSQG